jgi:hypothetical protein
MNQLFLFSGHSSDNSTVIPHLPIALDAGISSFSFFVNKKVQDRHVCQRKRETSETDFSSQSEEICVPSES